MLTHKYAQLEIKSSVLPWTPGERNKCYIMYQQGYIYFHVPSQDKRYSYRYREWHVYDKHGKPLVHVHCSDRTLTIHVGTYSVRFNKLTDYNKLKKCMIFRGKYA